MNKQQHKEWLFKFGLYNPDGLSEIPESACQELMDLIIDWAEDRKLHIGGGYKPSDGEQKFERKV